MEKKQQEIGLSKVVGKIRFEICLGLIMIESGDIG